MGKSLREGGIDVLVCSHTDGSLSVWQRHARQLTYACLGAHKLLPPPPKFGAAPSLVALAAGLWRGLPSGVPAEAGSGSDLASKSSRLSDGRRPPGMARRVSSEGAAVTPRGSADSGGGGSGEQEAGEHSGHSVLLMGIDGGGRVWQWQLPLLAGTLPDPKAKELPPPPKPALLGEDSRRVLGGRELGTAPAC